MAHSAGGRPAVRPTRAATGRTGLKRAARMRRIERAAAQVFSTRGYDGANFNDIAAALDLQGSSLYYYYASKEELFLRCVSHAAEQVFERLDAIARQAGDPAQALAALVREQVIIEVRDFPEFVPLFFKTRLANATLADSVLDLRRRHARIFESAAEAVRVRRGLDPHEVRVWLGIVFGALAYLPEWYDPEGPVGVDELADRMARTLAEPLTASSQDSP